MRSASTGSVLDARQAGRKPAAAAADNRITTTAANVGTSLGPMPYSSDRIRRETTMATAAPIANGHLPATCMASRQEQVRQVGADLREIEGAIEE